MGLVILTDVKEIIDADIEAMMRSRPISKAYYINGLDPETRAQITDVVRDVKATLERMNDTWRKLDECADKVPEYGHLAEGTGARGIKTLLENIKHGFGTYSTEEYLGHLEQIMGRW